MFSSKIFLIIAAITLLLLGATLFFQISEGQEYNMLQTLQERILGGGTDEALPQVSGTDSAEKTK